MQRPSWILMLALILVAGLTGITLGTLWDLPRSAYVRAKYLVRNSLNIEKNWVALPGPEQAEGRESVPCPNPIQTAVLVTGGQSNASNANPMLSESGPDDGVFVWFDGRCYPAQDPILGATSSGGSLWPNLGRRLAIDLGQPILFINGAVGGTQVGDWLDDRSGYYTALLTRVQTARSAGYEPDLILWHQGETDAGAERDMDLVERRFGTLADRLLADMPESRLYLFQASKCIGAARGEGVVGIRDAQAGAAEGRDRVILGMNTDTLGNDFRWDTCHFNSLGRTAIVEQIAPELSTLLR